MEQKLIKDLQPGDSILSFFVVRKKEIREKRTNREMYISFEFGDSSGRIRGSVWKDIHIIDKAIQISDIIKVKGNIITFHDYPHITIEKIRKATSKDNKSLEQFLPQSENNIDEMIDSLMQYIDKIKNKYLHELLTTLFHNNKILEKFKFSTAAKLWHHNYAGGLVEHTLSLIKICDFLQDHYPRVDRDLLLTAALLHDIGKIVELDAKGFFNYSTEGRLIGHITIGTQLITETINTIKDFPSDLKLRLLHCMLSHHGMREHGSPVVPMTVEALILHSADELDSKMGAFLRIIKKEEEAEKEWSNYVNLLDRFIYLGKDKKID